MQSTLFRFSSFLCTALLMSSTGIALDENSSADVNLTLLNGKSISGQIQKLDQGSLTITSSDTADEGEQLAVEEIERIQFSATTESDQRPNLLLRLVDGSLIVADKFTVSERVATVSVLGVDSPQPVKIPTKDIDWVRTQMSQTLDSLWADATKAPPASDTLYLLKEGELQTLEGIIQDVGETTFDFKLDGKVIEAKRERISGLAYYHAAGRELPTAIALCQDRTGSKLMVRSFNLEQAKADQGARLNIKLVCGSELSLPASTLASLDFTVGKILYISDIPVDGQQWSPQIDAGPLQKSLEQLLTWSKDRNLNGKPLTLYDAKGFEGLSDTFVQHEKEFSRGISLRSGTKLVYQIPPGYQKLTGLCGIDPQVRPQGNVILKFSSDGESLWSRKISGTAASPERIEFDIQNVKRLVVHVDYGKHADVADHLNICNLRLTK